MDLWNETFKLNSVKQFIYILRIIMGSYAPVEDSRSCYNVTRKALKARQLWMKHEGFEIDMDKSTSKSPLATKDAGNMGRKHSSLQDKVNNDLRTRAKQTGGGVLNQSKSELARTRLMKTG